MKNIFLFVLILALCACIPIGSFQVARADADDSYQNTSTSNLQKSSRADASFAYIDEDTTLYSLPENGLDGGESVAITNLPATYFCEILSDSNEYTDYYKVGYLDLVGLVKKDSVSIVDYTPKYKFASPKIRIADDVTGINIRNRPDNKNGDIVYTATNDEDFIYYGDIVGASPTAGIDKWYYTRLIDGDTTYYGYVYSIYVVADTIPPNIVEPEDGNQNNSGSVGDKASALQGTLLYIVIGSLSIPAVLIIWLLFKKRPAAKTPKKTSD